MFVLYLNGFKNQKLKYVYILYNKEKFASDNIIKLK